MQQRVFEELFASDDESCFIIESNPSPIVIHDSDSESEETYHQSGGRGGGLSYQGGRDGDREASPSLSGRDDVYRDGSQSQSYQGGRNEGSQSRMSGIQHEVNQSGEVVTSQSPMSGYLIEDIEMEGEQDASLVSGYDEDTHREMPEMEEQESSWANLQRQDSSQAENHNYTTRSVKKTSREDSVVSPSASTGAGVGTWDISTGAREQTRTNSSAGTLAEALESCETVGESVGGVVPTSAALKFGRKSPQQLKTAKPTTSTTDEIDENGTVCADFKSCSKPDGRSFSDTSSSAAVDRKGKRKMAASDESEGDRSRESNHKKHRHAQHKKKPKHHHKRSTSRERPKRRDRRGHKEDPNSTSVSPSYRGSSEGMREYERWHRKQHKRSSQKKFLPRPSTGQSSSREDERHGGTFCDSDDGVSEVTQRSRSEYLHQEAEREMEKAPTSAAGDEQLMQEAKDLEMEIRASKHKILRSSLMKERIELLHRNMHGKPIHGGSREVGVAGEERGVASGDQAHTSQLLLEKELVQLNKELRTEKRRLLKVVKHMEEENGLTE